MPEEKLYAAKGFSANGVTMEAGQLLDDQFDAQTVKTLVGMGRLVTAPPETDEDDEGAKAAKTAAGVEKKAAKTAATGLPGLPGV
jgi:hypothetical protein